MNKRQKRIIQGKKNAYLTNGVQILEKFTNF
jgi:hypothetical protein